jgi:hypothetical protein
MKEKIDEVEKWLKKHDPNYYSTKGKNNEEYKYLTFMQLRRVGEKEIPTIIDDRQY